MSSSREKGLFPLMIALLGAACGNEFSASSPGSGGTDAAVSMSGGASGKPNAGGTSSGGTASGGAANGGGGNAGKGNAGTGGRGTGGNDADSGDAGTAGKGPDGALDAGDGGHSPSGDAGPDADLAPSIPGDGLILWLRADRGVTAPSSLVSHWADQSPLHADAAQDVARSRPVLVADGINGRPALLFDGSDDFLQFGEGFGDFSKGISIFTVMSTSLVGEVCAPVFEASNGEEIDDINFGPNHDKINYEISDYANTDVACLPDVPQLFSVVQQASGAFEIHRDGSSGILSTFPPPKSIKRKEVFSGKSLYHGCQTFAGRIGEIIMYARALTDTESRAVESYLQKQYGCCSM